MAPARDLPEYIKDLEELRQRMQRAISDLHDVRARVAELALVVENDARQSWPSSKESAGPK